MNLGCIKPLCDLLTVMDSKIVQVALNGLENILRLGEQEAKQENNGTGVNPYCSLIEEAYGTSHAAATRLTHMLCPRDAPIPTTAVSYTYIRNWSVISVMVSACML